MPRFIIVFTWKREGDCFDVSTEVIFIDLYRLIHIDNRYFF